MITSRIIPHASFLEARTAIDRAIASAAPGQLIFVIGLAGSGKSELRHDAMWDYAGHPKHWGIGRVPAIAVQAPNADKSYFSPKEFMGRLMTAINEPVGDWLRRRKSDEPDIVHFEMQTAMSSAAWAQLKRERSEMAMRAAFERTARARGLKAIFIEQASSITRVQERRSPCDHMINYMCLAEEVGCILVLFGTPMTSLLWQGSTEVRRRARVIHIRRYRAEIECDRMEFAKVTLTLSKAYPVQARELIVNHLELLHNATTGVFGEMKEFFWRANESRVAKKREFIDREDLFAAVYPEAALLTLHEEARQFDKLVAPGSITTASRI